MTGVGSMSVVEVVMLGRFAVRVDGAEIPAQAWTRRHAAGLVKLLALAPRRQLHREQVIDALWPDVNAPADAGPRLHKAAHYARRVLGPDSLILRSDTVVLLPDATVIVDALDFAELATGVLDGGSAADAEQAAAAYTGTLLPDDLYESWTDEHRRRLESLYARLLQRAQRWADLADLDPTNEQAHLELMRRYAAQGDRRAALRQYERLDRALHRELGLAPGKEAVALRDALLAVPIAADAPATGVPLVGRHRQMRQLEQLVEQAGHGHGQAAFLSGPGGVGKSFLAHRLREKAATQGWRTGAGMASKIEGDWPYAPVLDAVADLCRRHPTLLDGLDDRCRHDIERALSGRVLDWSGDGGHQRLYVAVAELIRLAAAGTGTLLTIDNLHEADDASLRLVHYLARTGMRERFVLVLAHRRQPVTETFEQMRSGLLSRCAAVDVPLPLLAREDAAALVDMLRPGLPAETVDQIWRFSAGLPFAIVEVTRLTSTDGERDREPGAVVVDLLEPRVRAVLEHVAIAGSTFDTDEFLALSGVTEAEAFDCLDAALAAMVVERAPEGYRFRHDLIREALLSAVPPHRQRVLHRACAERLAGLGASPARVGHHLLAAGDTAAAVPHVLRAAETQAAVGAYRDALALVDSVRHVAAGSDRAQALALRADLLAAMGESAAPSAYREAIEAAAPDRRRLLRARLARMVAYGGDLETARELLTDLEPDGGPADPTIMLARAALFYFTGDLDAAREVADRARRLVVDGDTDWQVLELVALQGLLAHNRGEWYQQLGAELRRTKDDPALAAAVFDSHLCVAEYLLYGPMPYPDVIELATALRDTAGRSGAMRAVAFASALMGEAALLAGDLDLAERELHESIEQHREIGSLAGQAQSLQRLAELALTRGDPAGATRLLNRALPMARWSTMASHLIQRVYGTMIAAADGPEAARAVVDRARATIGHNDRCLFCEIMFAVPAAIACADVGDIDDARMHLAAAERSAGLWQGTAWQGAIFEARAHLARAEGDTAGAARLLAEAAAIFEGAGQPRDAARCRATYTVDLSSH
ncbi:MAG TPA: BREX system ATP-binding domain-containing protein [Actinoplanes sp.]|nr:BREX system ATP-binding domain-containing protein [Actinoplanes sp.]